MERKGAEMSTVSWRSLWSEKKNVGLIRLE